MLFNLPISNLRSDHYSLSRFEKRSIFGFISLQLKNSDRIANWRMGGEKACKTATFTYISYCDRITIQILNFSQSSEFVKLRLCCMINLVKKPSVYVRSWYQPCQDWAVQFFGHVWNRTELCFQSKPGPLAGYPDPLLVLPRCEYVGFRANLVWELNISGTPWPKRVVSA